MRGLADRSTLKEEGAILPKEKEKGQRQKDKEFDNLQREQFFNIDPLVDCNYQPIYNWRWWWGYLKFKVCLTLNILFCIENLVILKLFQESS